MDISWLGHSCFRLRSEQVVLLTDPYSSDSLGLRLGDPSANTITISRQHPHHSHLDEVTGPFRVFQGPGEYEYMGALLKGIMTSPAPGDTPDKRNTAYHIEMEGLHLCHLGDISSSLTPRQIDELTPTDVVFLPVGETCTVPVAQAQEMVRALSPRIVIPMHYALPSLAVQLGGLDAFLRAMGATGSEPQPRLNVTATNLPSELRVVVLNAQGVRT